MHGGGFVRGRYGRLGVLGIAGGEWKAVADDGRDGGGASNGEEPLVGLNSATSSARASAAGRKETPPTPPSPLFGATTFVNHYSFAQRAALGGSDSSSSSHVDAPPSPLISKGKTLHTADAAVTPQQLHTVHALREAGAAGGGGA